LDHRGGDVVAEDLVPTAERRVGGFGFEGDVADLVDDQ
jgi:hypothetical protein